jgi:hypothetical protein
VCGYHQCRAELEYDGRGRPPEYCPDRRWPPDNKTCKQMAAAGRAGERATGLDAALDDYRASTDRLIAAAGPLVRQLTDALTAVAAVRDGALARVSTAEQAALDAAQRVRDAEEVTSRSQRAQRAADADRDRARATAHDADLRAATARDDADRRVQEALRLVAAHEHGRGQAEATAAAAGHDGGGPCSCRG